MKTLRSQKVSFIRKIYAKYIKFLHPRFRREWKYRNQYIFNDSYRVVKENCVNLCWAGSKKGEIQSNENLGDYLALVITKYVLIEKNLCLDEFVSRTHFLYTVGSIIGRGFHDATIWGSGLLNERNALRCIGPSLDIRAVRGPVTRDILLHCGITCPAVYGDPAILLPRYYMPSVDKKEYEVSLILHHKSELRKENMGGVHYIEIQSIDYQKFVQEVLKSRVIISSALHGIILAESYGVPVCFLREELGQDIKFDDWFGATGRKKYKYIKSINEYSSEQVNPLPNLEKMREDLLNTFPFDLWS